MIKERCPVCSNENNIRVFLDGAETALTAAVMGSSRRSVSPGRILRCDACGMGFRQTRSTPQDLGELYSAMDTGVYESEESGRDATARRHLRIVERHARKGRLLDIGCASGLFLRHAAARGWEVAGIEPSRTLYAKARIALNGTAALYCTTFEKASLPEASFEAVTLWDVLEHVPDPVEMLRGCAGLLAPGGHLFLNVPDLESPEARLLRSRWPLLLPEHLNYFTRRSLALCAERVGLTHVAFGRRPAAFSFGYVLYRLEQHRLPGTAALRRILPGRIAAVHVPVYLGETLAVWRRAQEEPEKSSV